MWRYGDMERWRSATDVQSGDMDHCSLGDLLQACRRGGMGYEVLEVCCKHGDVEVLGFGVQRSGCAAGDAT